MKKSLLFSATALLLIAVITVATSCNKEESTRYQTTAEDLATHEDFAAQIDMDVDQGIEDRGGANACPIVTFAQPEGTWPNTITIDFGSGCTRPNGRVLKGKLIIEQSAEIRTPGAVRTIAHEDFYVDDVKVEGTRTWTNNGQNADGLWSYSKVATDMKLTFSDGEFTTWNRTSTSVLIEGGGTATHFDDVWSTTGEAEGVNRNGDEFTSETVEPLIKHADCRWISEGVIEFTVGTRTRSLDFGDGTCDQFGTLTLANGDTREIRLRR